uniref:Uncharacterized protein n=1 Tax=Candidatus Kentrum sp. TC TaxID=2126339 RepID=A0A450YU46_9GAMM|nr:MAG: protein of unknown function (DUF4747) [Candidatus Kentron sp. TC]
MRRLIKNLLTQKNLQEMYGEISVVVEPVEDALDKIFRMPHLRKLEIQINRPNSDPLHEYEKKFAARLKNQHAGKMRQDLTAKRNESLAPDDETRSLADLAQSNGYVRGLGTDQDGKPSEENTKEHPWQERVSYDPNTSIRGDIFMDKARSMMRYLRSKSQDHREEK